MCNNNCCMCCQCDKHDDDTPQEITYTSVCNSDTCQNGCKCCCCRDRDVCEDDPNVRIDGLEQKMEESCEVVNERITNLECNLEDEIQRSKAEDIKHDGQIGDLYTKESLDYNDVTFGLDDHNLTLNFYHDAAFRKKIEIPIESFMKDWFVDDVDLVDSHLLVIRFNVDPTTSTHHDPITITIDLYDFFNPSTLMNYYTKTEIDGKVNTINNNINTVAANLAQEKLDRAAGDTTNATNLTNFQQLVASTYETKTAAGNHVDGGSFDPVTRNLTLTRETASDIVIPIPDANTDTLVRQTVCTDDAAFPVILAYSNTPSSGTSAEVKYSSITINPHTSFINATADKANKDGNGNNIANTYETITDANNHLKNASFDNSTRKMTFTKQDNTTFDVTVPDANNYVTAASVSGHTLTLTRNGGLQDLTVVLPDDDHNYYVTGGSVSGNTLTLTRSGGLSDITISLPAWVTTDTNNYVTSATFANNTLTLGRNGGLSDVTCNIPIPAADSTNPIVDVSQSGTTVTFTYKDNTTESVTVGGGNVTYGGQSVTIQAAIDAIVGRLAALEGLWKKTANNDGLEPVTASHKVYGAGFYDTTVS